MAYKSGSHLSPIFCKTFYTPLTSDNEHSDSYDKSEPGLILFEIRPMFAHKACLKIKLICWAKFVRFIITNLCCFHTVGTDLKLTWLDKLFVTLVSDYFVLNVLIKKHTCTKHYVKITLIVFITINLDLIFTNFPV